MNGGENVVRIVETIAESSVVEDDATEWSGDDAII